MFVYWWRLEVLVTLKQTYLSRMSRLIHQIRLFNMTNTHAKRLQQPRIHPSLPPPNRIWVRPNRLILLTQKRICIEAIRLERPKIIILDARQRNWVMASNRYLPQDIVFLDGGEDVIGRYLVRGNDGSAVAKGGHDTLAGVAPLVSPCFLFGLLRFRYGECGRSRLGWAHESYSGVLRKMWKWVLDSRSLGCGRRVCVMDVVRTM